jgi:hypothetical protein
MGRKIFVFGLVAVVATAFAVSGAVRATALLLWDYPAEEVAGVTFKVYFSTNMSTPASNWGLVTNVTGTNVVVPISAGNGFWFVTASNEFGESGLSNIATSTVARNVSGVKIK